MLIEASILFISLGFGFGVAFLMVRRIKKESQIVMSDGVSVDLLLKKFSKEIAAALKEALKDLKVGAGSSSYYSLNNSEDSINIDETIIPINIKTEEVEANLDHMSKTESTTEDLSESKAKLASLLKKRK